MYALTLIQPWATAIARWEKRIENRTWEPPLSLLGTRIAIHAGKTMDLEGFATFVRVRGINRVGMQFDALPRGAVVATARLTGFVLAHEHTNSPWFVGPVGWVLGDVCELPEPVQCRGFQRLWNLPPDVEARVRAQDQGAAHAS